MLGHLLALGAGLAALRFLPALPPLPWLVLLATVSLLTLPTRGRRLGLAGLGLAWAALGAHWALTDQLEPGRDGQTFWLEGQVVGLPEQAPGVVRFELGQVNSRHPGLPTRLRLAWYGGPPLHAGERWRLAARLKRPSGLVNPNTFDYEAWLLARGIGATGTVKAGERLSPAGVAGWRDALRTRLRAVDAHGRAGAVAALVVGDGSGLSNADWTVLRDTGTVHLLVISGQHVSMLAGMLYFIVWVLARRGWWPRRLPWLPTACGTAMSGALVYGALAGFEVPVVRACLMVAVVLVWRVRFHHLGVRLPLLLAFDGALLINPLATLQPGFWLSFSAVALLALVFAGRLGPWRGWRSLLRAQWAMTLGLLPVLLASGLPVSVSGPLANLIAVPWVGAVVVPLSLLGTLTLPLPGVGEALLNVAGLLLEWLFDLLGWVASLQAAWSPAALPLWAWALVAAGVLLLLLPAGVPGRALGLVLLLPLLYPPIPRPVQGHAQVWVLDVGQGLSVLVRTRTHSLLYDAGPRHGDFDLGERVVIPAVAGLGVRRLDVLLLSHADLDHAGGAGAVAAMLHPVRIISGEPLRGGPASDPCPSGATWAWDGVTFALWQDPDGHQGNPASCVLRVEAGGERLLLTGDIDTLVEQHLRASGWLARADWLVLAHHGSRSSSSTPFLQALQARYALISRGRHNGYGHPHPEVLQRLQQLGMQVHDTALEGALMLELGAFDQALGQRAQARFWRRN